MNKGQQADRTETKQMNAQLLSIGQILQLADNEPIPMVRCRFVKIGDYKTGQNDNGPWSIQNCTVTDGAVSCKLKLWNRPELTREWTNVMVVFQALPGEKKPWLGLKKSTDEYRGKRTAQIEADERVTMVQDTGQFVAPVVSATPPIVPAPVAPVGATVGSTASPHPMAAPVQPALPVQSAPSAQPFVPAQSNRQAAPAPGSAEDQKECLRKARCYAGKLATSIMLSFDAAMFVGKHVSEKHKVQLSTEDIRSIAISINIALERGDYIGGLPSDPTKAVAPTNAID